MELVNRISWVFQFGCDWPEQEIVILMINDSLEGIKDTGNIHTSRSRTASTQSRSMLGVSVVTSYHCNYQIFMTRSKKTNTKSCVILWMKSNFLYLYNPTDTDGQGRSRRCDGLILRHILSEMSKLLCTLCRLFLESRAPLEVHEHGLALLDSAGGGEGVTCNMAVLSRPDILPWWGYPSVTSQVEVMAVS